jgi:heterodisulfide reductase subunit B
MAAYALITRNLALAEQQLTDGKQVVAPCSMCFLNMTKADHYLVEDSDLAKNVNLALGAANMHYTPGTVQARHLLEVLIEDIGIEAIAAKVTKPLSGLKVAPYYGCLITRPGYLSKFDNYEYPTSLDRIMKSLGATVVDYPMKAHCCGGHMTQISQEVALELIRQLLQNAAEYEADIIVTLCPMCQLNLDAYQGDVNRFFKTKYHIPILYFTQMIGLAFGLSASELGIGKELVEAKTALSKIGVVVPEPEPVKKKKPTKEELPMPRMPEEE